MDEFERTYLAKELPAGLASFPSKEMIDIYLPSTAHHANLRIRKRGETYEMTKKLPAVGTDSSHLIEETISLSKEEYAELSELQGKRIEKTRYYYKDGGVDCEVDVFTGDLAGLVLVDVEFPSAAVKDAFTMPSFCLAEVTQDEFIAGGMLCGKKYADIESNLARFGYQPLTIEKAARE